MANIVKIILCQRPRTEKNYYRRLCRLSSTREDFLAVVEPYQEALNRAGYNHQLLYQEPDPPAAAPSCQPQNKEQESDLV